MRNVLFFFFSKLGYFRNNHYFVEPLLEKKKPTSLSEPKKQTLVSALAIEE